MKLPVTRSASAVADLADIYTTLAGRSVAAAKRLAALLNRRCRVLASNPRLGRPREDLGPGLRSFVVERCRGLSRHA